MKTIFVTVAVDVEPFLLETSILNENGITEVLI